GVRLMRSSPPREPPVEAQMIVFPLARRSAVWLFPISIPSGRSDFWPVAGSLRRLNSQTVSPLGLTSRTTRPLSLLISVLPFFKRAADHGPRISYVQIGLNSLSYSTTLP